MPACLLESFVGRIDATRALRVLDLAQAAAFPHLEKGARQKWQDEQIRRLGPSGDAPHRQPSVRRTSLFFWNGQPIDGGGLKRAAAGQLGGRLHA